MPELQGPSIRTVVFMRTPATVAATFDQFR
jgi:hypothetical protein